MIESSLQHTVVDIMKWSTNIFTVIVLILFLVTFFRKGQYSCGFVIILILSLSSWLFPITDILKEFLLDLDGEGNVNSNQSILNAISSLEIAADQFVLFWTSAVALFTMSVLMNKVADIKTFTICCVLVCILLASIYPVTIYFNIFGIKAEYRGTTIMVLIGNTQCVIQDRISFFVLYDLIGKLIPLIIICYCYFRVYRVLKSPAIKRMGIKKTYSVNRILWYCFIPILCFVPSIIIDALWLFPGAATTPQEPFWIYLFEAFPVRIWGLLNLLTYWVMTFTKPNRTSSAFTPAHDRIAAEEISLPLYHNSSMEDVNVSDK